MVKESPSPKVSSVASSSAGKASGADSEITSEVESDARRLSREEQQEEQQKRRERGKSTKFKIKDWILFDARGLVVGRLASEVARQLRGKDNPAFRPNQDSGRGVVVVNTAHMHFTGDKRQQKMYYRHTGYPGGIKSRSAKELFEKNRSTDILRHAVKGMLPRGVLGRAQLQKLRLYADEAHKQEAQQPRVADFAAANAKNSKR